MLNDMPDVGLVERVVRNGLEEEIGRIIDEEAALARDRVASRVQEMKQGAIGRVLAKFRLTQVQNPEAWTYTLKFEL